MKKLNAIHPLLFAIFPVIFLFSHNMDQFNINIIFAPLILILSFSLLLGLLLGLILKDIKKSALIVSIFLILSFSYGHLSSFLAKYDFYYLTISRNFRINNPDVLLIPLYLLLFGVLSFVIPFMRRDLGNITRLLNLTSCFLLLTPLSNVGFEYARRLTRGQDPAVNSKTWNHAIKLSPAPSAHLPNVYYIILDAYARADVLKSIYNYDNSEFLTYLSSKGFFVASKSHSNYMMTDLSLASSLNLNYLDQLTSKVGAHSKNIHLLRQLLIKNNFLIQAFQSIGYKTVCFSSGYYATEIQNADIYIRYPFHLGEFNLSLLNSTFIMRILSLFRFAPLSLPKLHAQGILFTFDHLTNLPRIQEPIFVFSHISFPHSPYVFDRQGSFREANEPFPIAGGDKVPKADVMNNREHQRYIYGYREQVIFANVKIKEMIEGILSNSSRPAIIVLQGDHGPDSFSTTGKVDQNCYQERSSIFNAYYFPDQNYNQLYEGISPVNTWRVILNQYFGAHYELLPDKSYFSWYHDPYKFQDITDSIIKK